MSADGNGKKQYKPKQNGKYKQKHINSRSKSHDGDKKDRYLTDEIIPITSTRRGSDYRPPRMTQLQINISNGNIGLVGSTGEELTADERFALFKARLPSNREYTCAYDLHGGFVEFDE